ncbi:MAG: hypothetical protein R2854_08440 [Caldilineaceae bacterium]
MHDLTAFTLKDMTTCGAALRGLGDGAADMETVADRTVRYLYDHLVDPRRRPPHAALVRFFITKPYATGRRSATPCGRLSGPRHARRPRRQVPDAPRHRGRPPGLAQPPPLHATGCAR